MSENEEKVVPVEEEISGEETAPEEITESQADVTEVENEVQDVSALLEEQKNLVAEVEDRYKRLQADFLNFRRRNEKERLELSSLVTQNIIKDLLPIVDNFQRAMAVEKVVHQSFYEGVQMIYNQLMETLKKEGLEEIKAEGEKFDPNYHQAVMREEDPEKEDDTISAVLQKGYMVKGKVIRPAMVKVVAN